MICLPLFPSCTESTCKKYNGCFIGTKYMGGKSFMLDTESKIILLGTAGKLIIRKKEKASCTKHVHKIISSVQFSCSVVSDSLRPHKPQHTRPPCPPKPMSIESVMPSNHLILCHSLLFLPSIFPSIRVFFNESILHIRWPKHWSFNFNISLSNEHPGLISFRMD